MAASASAVARPTPILPAPAKSQAGPGQWTPGPATPLVFPAGDMGARAAAERLSELIGKSRGFVPSVTVKDTSRSIRFRRADGFDPEAYSLEIKPDGATISATDGAGLFYGAISLWQLMTSGSGAIDGVRIDDAPRFAWRGMMLDSARHFQSPEFIKQLIDWMAAHKLNRLHWHLVDDQGWRLEIVKYPELTQTSAWRTPATALGAPPLPRTGGFYTQAQVREIVAYAEARHIQIVPEIELPGHALSAIRAYPGLGTGAAIPAGVESDWGVFPWLYNSDDTTFAFLEDVLGEVMALFPSRYIHIGGDEAVKDQWKASPKIQARIRSLGLKDEQAMQSWFIGKIERFLTSHDRKLIGWDEILDGGIAPGATIMSWRGVDGAVAAAEAGHDAILSPAPDLYLDHVQGDGPGEPPGRGGAMTLSSIYAFDPSPVAIPEDQQRHILGLQGNLWTEHVRTEQRAAYMAFPRMSALAELAWSGQHHRPIGEFTDRLIPQLERLKPFGLSAALTAFTPQASLRPKDGRGEVTLSNEIGADMRFTLDGSAPNARSPRYRKPIVTAYSKRLRAASFRNGTTLPGEIDLAIDANTVRRRSSSQLKLCSSNIALRLEDDAPATGARAAFLLDIMNPCWIYERAELDGIKAIALDVGQIPFNFQIGSDREKIRFRPPTTPEGEMEVRLDGCTGQVIAVLPLAKAARNPAVTRLEVPIDSLSGSHDLCVSYTSSGVNPLWALDAIQLVPSP